MLSINIDGENIFIINNHLRANYNDGNWDEDERKEALGKLEEYINQFLPEENLHLHYSAAELFFTSPIVIP